MDVTSCIAGTNADLMRAVAELYIEDGDLIVDATFGEGGFWRRLPELEVVRHDRFKGDGVDLRALPEKDGTVDVLALDPPYRFDESQGGGRLGDFLDRYGLNNAGLDVVDLFVLMTGTGPGSGAWKTQHRARKTHSYLLVLARSRYWRHRDPRHRRTPEDRLTLLKSWKSSKSWITL